MTAQRPIRPDGTVGALRLALVRRIDALDGYPVAALIDAWPHDAGRVNAVLRHVLEQWIERLDDDLRVLPADASPPLSDIKRRMQETRGAMVQLLDLVCPLDEQRIPGPGADHRQPSAQTLEGAAGNAQLH